MVLKEAYRYQNYLTKLINEAQYYLNRESFVTTTRQTHNRKQINPDAQDETIEVQKPNQVEFTPTQLIDFVIEAIDEKQKLSDAITEAKRYLEIDIDSSIAMNKIKQDHISTLVRLSNIKPIEKQERGIDYKFDIEGRQGTYTYIIDSVTTIDYDRKNVKALIKKLTKETNEISTKIDTIELTRRVEFEARYDITDTLEDIVV